MAKVSKTTSKGGRGRRGAQEKSPETPARTRAGKAAGPKRDLAKQAERAREFSIQAARLLHDDKCTEIVVLDVRSLSQVSDFLVIASGTSDRQMRSCLGHVEEFGLSTGHRVMRAIADEAANWLVADCVDVVIHLFEPSARMHYDLENLWGDAPRIEWARPEGTPESPKPRRRTIVRQESEGAGQ